MKNCFPARPFRGLRGFTLVEILVVVAIISILATMVLPMLRSPGRAIELKSAADNLKLGIQLARQDAVTLNGSMEIRFYRKTQSDPFTAYQIYTIDSDDQRQPHYQLQTLPQGLIIPGNTTLSPLVTTGSQTNIQTNGNPAVKNWNYSSIVIWPSGAFSNVSSTNAFVTLVETTAPIVANSKPANYAQVKLQPLTGLVSVEQP